MPRIDPTFAGMVQESYAKHEATHRAVDSLLEAIGEEAVSSGQPVSLAWVSAFQGVVALDMIAKRNGDLSSNDTGLLSHFRTRQSQA